MPSVVRAEADGTLLAGEPDLASDDPLRTGRDFKRRLGDPTPLILGGQPHSAVSLLAATLKAVVATVTTTEGEPPERVVLTHPAVWGPYRREQFAEAPDMAGLDPAIVTIITEPEAAANHYATRQGLSDGDIVTVYDLGGGTFDTTVTQTTDSRTGSGMKILGTPEGVEWVGGVDFDEAVLAHVDQAVDGAFSVLDPRDPAAAIALQRIRAECVRAKERLSREAATNIPVLLPHRHTQVRLTRAEFEAMIRTTLDATMTGLHRTLRSASLEPEDLAGILLVGGSSRIPLVAQMLSADLGRPVLIDPHPQHCVALGAGTIAGRGLTGTRAVGRRSRADSRTRLDSRPRPDSRSGLDSRSRLDSRPRPASRPDSRPDSRPRPGRRTVIAATAAVALLAGGGTFLARDSSILGGDEKQVATEQLSIPIAPATATPGEATGTPAFTTPSAEPTPKSTTKAKTTKKATQSGKGATKITPTQASTTAAKPNSLPLPVSGTVIGLADRCLDVANTSDQNGTPIWITECNGTGAQVWNLRTDHTFRALGKCMDVGTAADGAAPPVQLQDCSGGASQKWRVVDGTIIHTESELCLDIVDNTLENRMPTELNPCADDVGQEWKVSGAT